LGTRSAEDSVAFPQFFPLHEIVRRPSSLMEIMQVSDTLICTFRVAGLDHMHLRILVNNKGKKLVAVDPVGARKGNWVFTASGSAARHACPDNTVLTDLTIGGIIDHWTPDG
jgi:carboxysome peptide B